VVLLRNIIIENPNTMDKVAVVLGEENLGGATVIFVALHCGCFEYHNGLSK
jgi:hypothetical protein